MEGNWFYDTVYLGGLSGKSRVLVRIRDGVEISLEVQQLVEALGKYDIHVLFSQDLSDSEKEFAKSKIREHEK